MSVLPDDLIVVKMRDVCVIAENAAAVEKSIARSAI